MLRGLGTLNSPPERAHLIPTSSFLNTALHETEPEHLGEVAEARKMHNEPGPLLHQMRRGGCIPRTKGLLKAAEPA